MPPVDVIHAGVSTHASVRRRRELSHSSPSAPRSFNSRLREEATCFSSAVSSFFSVSTHASVRRRQLRVSHGARGGGFNSRLREEATWRR